MVTMARNWILTVGLGFAAIGVPTAQANNDDYPVRGNWLYQLGFRRFGPIVQPSYELAPWYLWWPANATERLTTHDFQSSPYPTWPGAHPVGMVPPAGPAAFSPAPGQSMPGQLVTTPRPVPSYPYGR